MESPNPPWFKPGIKTEEESVPSAVTPERSPVLQSILDVLDKEPDKDTVVELSDMLSEWREVTKKNSGGNPMVAHERILTFVSQLGATYADQEMDKVLLFHLISGSTVNGANKALYILDIPAGNPNGQGAIESEIRALSSSIQ